MNIEDEVVATVQPMDPIPAGANPFNYDLGNMGTDLVRGWMIMHEGYDSKGTPLDLHYVILINTRNGQRIKINLRKRSGEKSLTPSTATEWSK